MAVIIHRYQFRRGTAAEWSAANPVLLNGEPGFETDTKKRKLGDGVTAWNSLAYDTALVADGDKGDITVAAGVWTIDNDVITNAKAADMAQATIKGRASGAGTGDPTDLTSAQVHTVLGLGNIATQSAAAVNITGGTISGLTAFTLASGNLNISAGNLIIASDASGGGLGGARIERSAGQPGIFSVYSPASVRQGFFGWSSGSRMQFVAEGSNTGVDIRGQAAGDVRLMTGTTVRVSVTTTGMDVTGASTATTWLKSGSYTVATVPAAATAGAGASIYVSNESGGAVVAFSDATNWRRVTDRAIIS